MDDLPVISWFTLYAKLGHRNPGRKSLYQFEKNAQAINLLHRGRGKSLLASSLNDHSFEE